MMLLNFMLKPEIRLKWQRSGQVHTLFYFLCVLCNTANLVLFCSAWYGGHRLLPAAEDANVDLWLMWALLCLEQSMRRVIGIHCGVRSANEWESMTVSTWWFTEVSFPCTQNNDSVVWSRLLTRIFILQLTLDISLNLFILVIGCVLYDSNFDCLFVDFWSCWCVDFRMTCKLSLW